MQDYISNDKDTLNYQLYDEEKIVRDILDLNYYKYGNLYITSQGSVSLYKFLPDYEYGLTTETVSIIEVWKKNLYRPSR